MEPERKIEKWLKAYAKKRRTQAGEPFKLPPATRRLLQSEVARDKPKPEEDDESVSLWDVLRQQWAILLSFAACVFLVGMIFFHSASVAKKKAETVATLGGPAPAALDKSKNEYTQKEDFNRANGNLDLQATNGLVALDQTRAVTPSAAPELSESIAATPIAVSPGTSSLSPTPAPVPAGGDYAVAESAGSLPPTAGFFATNMPVAEPPPSTMAASSDNVAPPPPTEQAPETMPATASPIVASAPSGAFPSGQASEKWPSDQPVGATKEAVPPGGTFSAQLQSQEGFVPAAAHQFSETQNLFQNSITPSQAAPVLANFHVLQNGNAIRIIDQDGSVYDGSLQTASQETRKDQQQNVHVASRLMQNAVNATTGLPGQQVAAAADALKVAQNYFFRVYGTNRTMKQNVVFTGSLVVNYTPATNAASVSGTLRTFDDGSGHSGGGGGGGGFGGFGGTTASSRLPDQTVQLPWSNVRITGTAIINRTNQIEVNAAPVTPGKN
jgi:hypothetical protein